MIEKMVAALSAILMICGPMSKATYLHAQCCPGGDCPVDICPCPQDPITPNCQPAVSNTCIDAPCDETCADPCDSEPPCDPLDPCAPVCGTQCAICYCTIGIGIIAIAAAAAIIITSGNDSSNGHQ